MKPGDERRPLFSRQTRILVVTLVVVGAAAVALIAFAIVTGIVEYLGSDWSH